MCVYLEIRMRNFKSNTKMKLMNNMKWCYWRKSETHLWNIKPFATGWRRSLRRIPFRFKHRLYTIEGRQKRPTADHFLTKVKNFYAVQIFRSFLKFRPLQLDYQPFLLCEIDNSSDGRFAIQLPGISIILWNSTKWPTRWAPQITTHWWLPWFN